jgi:hypothetical protein
LKNKNIYIAIILSISTIFTSSQTTIYCMDDNKTSIFGNLTAKQRYFITSSDTQQAIPYEVYNKLVPVAPWNLFQNIYNEQRILVSSYMSIQVATKYFLDQKKDINKYDNLKLNRKDIDYVLSEIKKDTMETNDKFPDMIVGNSYADSWFTICPELYNKTTAGTNQQNINEYLGLPPQTNEEIKKSGSQKVIVELWISPSSLKRPSPSSCIFTLAAYPEDQQGYANPFDYIKNTQIFNTWYKDWKKDAYNKYFSPWTRMGYTFDYSQEAFNDEKNLQHYGCTEYVVPKGTNAKTLIHKIYSIDKYTEKSTRYIDMIKNQVLNKLNNLAKDLINKLLLIKTIKEGLKTKFGSKFFTLKSLYKPTATIISIQKQLLYIIQEIKNKSKSNEDFKKLFEDVLLKTLNIKEQVDNGIKMYIKLYDKLSVE